MEYTVHYVEPIRHSDMGRGRVTFPRDLDHANMIMLRLHQAGIDHAWIMHNDQYLTGYIRDPETRETFWD